PHRQTRALVDVDLAGVCQVIDDAAGQADREVIRSISAAGVPAAIEVADREREAEAVAAAGRARREDTGRAARGKHRDLASGGSTSDRLAGRADEKVDLVVTIVVEHRDVRSEVVTAVSRFTRDLGLPQ